MMQLAGEVHRAKEMFFAQLLNSCHVITAPRQHTHVTMQTTGYKVDSLPRSDELSDGPKQPARRPSLDSLREAWVAGGSAKPGGIPPPRPSGSLQSAVAFLELTLPFASHTQGDRSSRRQGCPRGEIRRDTRRTAAMLIPATGGSWGSALLARVKARKILRKRCRGSCSGSRNRSAASS